MAAPNTMPDAHIVARELKANKGHRGRTADALGVSRYALYLYLNPKPPRKPPIIIECDYIVIEQPTVIDAHAKE